MEQPLPNTFLDKVGPLPLGMNSGLDPALLSPLQASMLVNATCRGGHAHTRPPIRKLSLSYSGSIQMVATRALFQGAAFYQALGNNPNALIASIGGRLFRYTITSNSVVVDEITPLLGAGPALDVNDPTRPQAWLAQGQDFMVINDGQALPYFFDGSQVVRSRGYAGQQLPAGRQIHYVNGRFVMVLADPNKMPGISYIASDLVYNTDSGTAAYNYRDAILYIKDNQAILGGLAFAVPVTAGEITALFSTAVSDTSLGQGPLQVATSNGIYSTILPLDATLWTTTQQPTQVVALPNGGPTGQYAVTTVNGDAWYRAPDGLRSFVVARRDFNTWVQTPLSFEMARVLPYDTQGLLPWASAVNFGNRLLVTASPFRVVGRGIVHRGLVALDFNNISSLTTRSQPAYDGLWTGLPILQLVKGKFAGVERCFIFALDASDSITLYELGTDDAGWFDSDGTNDVGIASWLETSSLFGRESDSDRVTQPLKKLITGDLFLEGLVGPTTANPSTTGRVTFTVQFRSDQYPCWQDWHTFNLCAPACYTPEGCSQPLTVREQYATFQRLPEAPDVCNTTQGRQHRQGYLFQLKLSWTGHAAWQRVNVWATPVPATRNVLCSDGTCEVLTCCEDSLFTYSIESPLVCDLSVVQQPVVAYPIEWDATDDAPTVNEGGGTIIVTEDPL